MPLNAGNDAAGIPNWPTDMLPPRPPLAAFFNPVVRTVVSAPAMPSGDFDSHPRPPKPNYNDPRAWAAYPSSLFPATKTDTTAVEGVATADLAPPSCGGACVSLHSLCASSRVFLLTSAHTNTQIFFVPGDVRVASEVRSC